MKRRGLPILFGIIGLASIGCQSRDITLPTLGKIPTFQLTDQAGKRFSSQDLDGKVWVGNFIFTSCQGTCPLLTERMKEVQKVLQVMAKDHSLFPAKIVSFSVDPERDTPEKLLAYANTHGADLTRWAFLTGPLDEVTQTVVRGFKISMGKLPASTPLTKVSEGDVFDVLHSEKFILVDPQGHIRGYYDSDRDGIKKLIQGLQSLLKQVIP